MVRILHFCCKVSKCTVLTVSLEIAKRKLTMNHWVNEFWFLQYESNEYHQLDRWYWRMSVIPRDVSCGLSRPLLLFFGLPEEMGDSFLRILIYTIIWWVLHSLSSICIMHLFYKYSLNLSRVETLLNILEFTKYHKNKF